MQAISAHPFTICSSPSVQPDEKSELVFYLRHQGGFTAKLYQYALERPGASLSVLVDRPYGGINLQKYNDCDHLLVIVGGSGAGWSLPFIERFVRYGSSAKDEEQDSEKGVPDKGICESNTSGPILLRVILATREISSRIWFLRTINELLSKYLTTDSSSVRVQVYLTGNAAKEVDPASDIKETRAGSEASEPSSTDKIHISAGHDAIVPGKEFGGRPELRSIIQEEAVNVREAGQSLGVFVCGPTTMQNDVRNAVAEENLRIVKGSKAGGVYLHSEQFSWA
jgi:NAD(P)H-flavin reductase